MLLMEEFFDKEEIEALGIHIPSELKSCARTLDMYYIGTRYPMHILMDHHMNFLMRIQQILQRIARKRL